MSTTGKQRPCDRLKAARKRLGKSQTEMAEALRLSLTGYQNYEQGKRDIPAQVVDALVAAHAVNAAWLWDGKGEMFVTSQTVTGSRNLIAGRDFLLGNEGRPGDTPENDTPAKRQRRMQAIAVVHAACDNAGLKVSPALRVLMRELVAEHGVTADEILELAQVVHAEIDAHVNRARLEERAARELPPGDDAIQTP